MAAFSFKRRFVEPIRRGLVSAYPDQAGTMPKRQTIRAERKDRRRPKPGETLSLYHGMRTKQCFLIGRARCTSVHSIVLDFSGMIAIDRQAVQTVSLLDGFACRDGFKDFAEMRQFWRETHASVQRFEGVLIKWEPLP